MSTYTKSSIFNHNSTNDDSGTSPTPDMLEIVQNVSMGLCKSGFEAGLQYSVDIIDADFCCCLRSGLISLYNQAFLVEPLIRGIE